MAPPETEVGAVQLQDANYSAIESQVVEKSSSRAQAQALTLEWKNLSYKVTDVKAKTEKTILHNMSGKASPGKLLGIMGTSGAGKSTLLDCLAGRISDHKSLRGSLTVNGNKMDRESFKRVTGYVMQDDALFPLLTVRETIRYAAALRCSGLTSQERDAVADATLSMMKLDKCAETIIGDANNRGLSGGERRRVSIAQDLVSSPSLIFLDEPTSGLDSSTALSVIEVLKEMAESKACTIIMTIHQPSARLFSLLDDVIFLANGQITYSGSVASLKGYIETVHEQAGFGPAPVGNTPEVMLDMCDQLIKDSKLNIATNNYAGEADTETSSADGLTTESQAAPQYANSFVGEIAILFSRAMKNVVRTPELFFARVGASTGFGILLGTLFLNTQDDLLGLQHRLSYFVFIAAFYYYTSLEALPIFLAEREIFAREFSRGAYRAGSYTVAQTLVTLPPYFFVSVWFSCITWWLVGLQNNGEVFMFHILIVFTVLVAGSSFATLVSTLVPSPMVGQSAGSGLLSVMFLFSGFFIKAVDIPNYWIWLNYLSLVRSCRYFSAACSSPRL